MRRKTKKAKKNVTEKEKQTNTERIGKVGRCKEKK